MSGTVIEIAPNRIGVLGRVLGAYRTNTRAPGIAVEVIPAPGIPVSNSYRALPKLLVSGSNLYRTWPGCSAGYCDRVDRKRLDGRN